MSKSPSLRRIQADIRELALDPSDQYHAAPLENDMFEWHFTIRGAEGTDFEGGVYHGRILLPPDYPFKPPHIMFLTPSGRFETNTKICLSFSAYHPELWQPAWGIRLILEALISFLPTPADGAIGALDWSSEERKRLAKKSRDFVCPICGKVEGLIPKREKSLFDSPIKPSRFAREIEQLQRLQMQEHHKKDEDDNDDEEKQKADDRSEKNDEVEASERDKPSVEEGTQIAANNTEAPETEDHESGETNTPRTEPDASESASDLNQPAQSTGQVEIAGDRPPSSKVWWVIDPLLQLIIVVLSAICYLLLRKVQGLCADLRALD